MVAYFKTLGAVAGTRRVGGTWGPETKKEAAGWAKRPSHKDRVETIRSQRVVVIVTEPPRSRGPTRSGETN